MKDNHCLFKTASEWAKEHFGKRIQKIPIDAGFSCPNRDGKLSFDGCLYCNNKAFSPFYTNNKKSITTQLEEGINFFSKRYNCNDFFAYFQSYSGTYSSIDILEKKYREALTIPNIIGLIIATRPDCINESIVDLLLDLKKETYVRIEIGVESFDDNVLKSINRCHTVKTALNAIAMLREAQLDTSVHLIFGLPNEPLDVARVYSQMLSDTGANFVKLHHLQIVEGSRLAELYKKDNDYIKLHSLESYLETLSEFISNLKTDIIFERFINRVPKDLLIAPKFGNINENQFLQMLLNKIQN